MQYSIIKFHLDYLKYNKIMFITYKLLPWYGSRFIIHDQFYHIKSFGFQFL